MKHTKQKEHFNPFSKKSSLLYSKAKYQQIKKPYNINISFNINPKNIINQQIDKLYNIAQDDYTSLYQLRQATKKQKNNCKFDCYMENQNLSKSNSRVKKNSPTQKCPLNLKKIKIKNQDKHKTSQSILKQKFIKLNKMKKSLLEKIGSLDISLENENQQNQLLNYNIQKKNEDKQENNLQQLQLSQSKQMHTNQHKQFIKNYPKIQQQDLITQKLSEYQPEQLISYQNQKSQKQQKIGHLDLSDSFPMIFHNSLAIKKQYQKNYNQNFSNPNNQSKSRGKKVINKKTKKSSQIKAPISARLHYQVENNKNRKMKKGDIDLFKKIKVIHQKILSSQSFKHLYKSTQLNDSQNERKKQKEFIIKTENQFQQIKNEIQFYSQLNSSFQQKRQDKNEQKQKSQGVINIGLNSQILQNQEFRPTQQIIQSYVYEISQMIQMRKLKEQIQNQKKINKINKNQVYQDQNRFLDFQESQSQSNAQYNQEEKSYFQNQQKIKQIVNSQKYDFQNQDQKIQQSKQLQQSQSQNGQKQSQKSQSSFTFALKQTQLIKQQTLQSQKKELSRSNPYQSLEYSQEFLQNIKKKSFNKNQCDTYFQQENQVYIKKCQNKEFKSFESQKKEEQNQLQQNSDVDSYIYGDNQFYNKNDVSSASSSSQQIHIQDQDQLTLKRLNKVALQRKMREQLQMRLIKLKQQKNEKNSKNNIKNEQTHQENGGKLQELMNLIKKQLSKQQCEVKPNHQDNIIKLVCEQLETMYETMKKQENQEKQLLYKNENNYLAQSGNSQEIHKFQTPNKNEYKKWQQKAKKHNRNLSTENKYTKQQQNSNDLTLWDLQLLQSSLNRRYKDISANKQKIFQQIAADQTLDDYSFTKKIKDLKQWERQNKAQILKTKIKITKNMKNYIKIINQDQVQQKNSSIPKCFSQQYLKSFNLNQEQINSKNNLLIKGQIKQLNRKLNQNQGQLIFKKEDILYIKKNSNSSQNSEQQQEDRQIQQFQRLKQRHYNTFKQDEQNSSNSSAIQNNQYEFDQANSDDEQIIKLQNQKGQFAELMNRPLFKLHKADQQDFLQVEVEEDNQHTSQLQLKIKEKLVTQQQKLDIFEFIFLDLCIQLYQETIDYEQKQAHKGKLNSGPHRILDSIWKFLKSQKKIPKKKGPKIGIYTGLSTVKQYLQKLLTFVMTYKQKKQKNDDRIILHRLNVPLGPTAFDLLKSMRFNTQYDYEEDSNGNFQNQALNSLVLPIYTFTDFQNKIQAEKEFQFQNYFEDQEKQKNRLIFLKNMTHVHHKAIFDALNQMLDFQRPFGIWGKPFPWKKKVKEVIQNQQELNLSIKKSSQKVNECALYMCGLLVDKEESLVKDANISSAYLQEVKEDRMSKLIINDFIQNQSRWSFLDDQQTQVLLQISYIVWIVMLQETLKQIKPLFNRRLQSE